MTSLLKSDTRDSKTVTSLKLFFEFVSKRSIQHGFFGFLKRVGVFDRHSRL